MIIVCSVSKKTSAAPNVRNLAHFRIPALTQEGMARVLCTIIRQNKKRDWKSGDGTMPENIIQIDQNLPGTRLDRLITEKMTQILNAMLDAATVASVRLRQRRSVSGATPQILGDLFDRLGLRRIRTVRLGQQPDRLRLELRRISRALCYDSIISPQVRGNAEQESVHIKYFF